VLLRGVNKIKIIGKTYDQITLKNLNGTWIDVEYLIVDDHSMNYGVLLGRKFSKTHIKLVYYKRAYSFENDKKDDFVCSIFAM